MLNIILLLFALSMIFFCSYIVYSYSYFETGLTSAFVFNMIGFFVISFGLLISNNNYFESIILYRPCFYVFHFLKLDAIFSPISLSFIGAGIMSAFLIIFGILIGLFFRKRSDIQDKWV